MRFGKGKMAMFASMLALAANSALAAGKELTNREQDEIVRRCRHMRSGFTSNSSAKKKNNRKNYQIAFESRRRNRK